MALESMAIAHFHHHLRPVEADEEEASVRALAERLGVPYRRGDWTRPGREDLPHSDRNLQAAARRARYEFLLTTAKEMDIPVVVTAHHRDDQVETIFFNLSRGGGTGAWQGIRPAIQRQGVWILRPLLAFSREDLLAYLSRLGESHREDSSNLSRKYSRNRIRHELLPEAVSHGPGLLEDLLARNASAQSEEAKWLEVLESVKAESLRRGDVWTLPRKRFDLMPEEGCFYCLRRLLWEISGAGEGWYPVRRKSLTALLGLLKSGGEGEVTLPGRVRVRLRGATLVLQKVK
jgi:tRNA(Ile)-lysidine synthase